MHEFWGRKVRRTLEGQTSVFFFITTSIKWGWGGIKLKQIACSVDSYPPPPGGLTVSGSGRVFAVSWNSFFELVVATAEPGFGSLFWYGVECRGGGGGKGEREVILLSHDKPVHIHPETPPSQKLHARFHRYVERFFWSWWWLRPSRLDRCSVRGGMQSRGKGRMGGDFFLYLMISLFTSPPPQNSTLDFPSPLGAVVALLPQDLICACAAIRAVPIFPSRDGESDLSSSESLGFISRMLRPAGRNQVFWGGWGWGNSV